MSKSKSQATRGSGAPLVPWYVLLLTGVLIGLGLAGLALYRGWLPSLRGAEGPQPNPQATAPRDDAGTNEADPAAERKPTLDFYNVLPEMETVVPEAEIAAATSRPQGTEQTSPGGARLFLQAGSFRAASDAEQMKARLALLGQRASLAEVTVNGLTWHRVRIGPFADARELDLARRTLADNGISAIALREAQ